MEYDIYLYNLCVKDWVLIFGDLECLLEEVGCRLYGGEVVQLLDVGEVYIDFDLGEQVREMGVELDVFFIKILILELKVKVYYLFDGFDVGVY